MSQLAEFITQDIWPIVLGLTTLGAAASAALHAILHKKDARAAVSWVGLIALVPLLGAFLYMVLGVNRIRRKAWRIRRSADEAWASSASDLNVSERRDPHLASALSGDMEHLRGLDKLVGRITRRELLAGNHITLLRDGDAAYPQMLDAIDGAERSVLMSTYIFDNDHAGQRFIDALTRAEARGVDVRVIVDSVGARYSFPSAVGKLRRAGVAARTFLPILIPWKFSFMNLRTHRKILVVDGALGFTGGINIRHGHLLGDRPDHPTHDTHFRVEGPVVSHLQETLVEDWAFVSGELDAADALFPPLEPQAHDALARGIADGPDEDFANLKWVFAGALSVARERVVIITPYFLPDEALVHALQVTALRGVQVDIILPERSNLPFVDWASAPIWGGLLDRGCRIWLSPPPFDHSKLMVIDGVWSIVGSANWDPRSLLLNFEFNVEVYDPALASDILAIAEDKIVSAREVTPTQHHSRSVLRRLRDGIFRLGAPYL